MKSLDIGRLIDTAVEDCGVVDLDDGCLEALSMAIRNLPREHPLEQLDGITDSPFFEDEEDAPHLDSHFEASLQCLGRARQYLLFG